MKKEVLNQLIVRLEDYIALTLEKPMDCVNTEILVKAILSRDTLVRELEFKESYSWEETQ